MKFGKGSIMVHMGYLNNFQGGDHFCNIWHFSLLPQYISWSNFGYCKGKLHAAYMCFQ